VDVSVFIADKTDTKTRRDLHDALVAVPHVARVYTETKRQAIEEFQRLYTCTAGVPRSAIPASYRLVLDTVTTPQRDALVRRIYRLPGVGDVSCDPVSPCVGVGSGG
jgi:cell division protein FtsX